MAWPCVSSTTLERRSSGGARPSRPPAPAFVCAAMDEHTDALYQHAFNPDIMLLPQGSINFGRGLTTRREHLGLLGKDLKERLEKAHEAAKAAKEQRAAKQQAAKDKTEAAEAAKNETADKDEAMPLAAADETSDDEDSPRSTLACGIHPETKCATTGQEPIRGVRYHFETQDLCQAGLDELDSSSQDKYEAVDPTVFPSVEPTDDDDGLLAVALPGTRRALALLIKKAQQYRFINLLDHEFLGRR